MKPFNRPASFPKAEWHKWALAGSLVASLVASMSFNPDSKYVARNEFKTHGEYALASKCLPTGKDDATGAACTPDAAASPDPNLAKPADKPKEAVLTSREIKISIDDFTQAVGIYDVAAGKVMYSIEKRPGANTDGAEYCLKCATEIPIKSLDMTNSGLKDGIAIDMFIKADAQKQIAKLDKEASDDSSSSTVVRNSTFKYNIKCTGYGTGRDTDFDGLLTCQHDGLDKAIAACKAKVDADQEKRESKRSSRSTYSSYYDDDSTQYRNCDRFATNYTRTKVMPMLKAALANPDFHDSAIEAIQNLTGADGILDGMTGESSLESEMARALAQADAREALNEIKNRDLQDQAKSICMQAGYAASGMASQCMQQALSTAGWNAYSNVVTGDRNNLGVDGFNAAALQVFTTAAVLPTPPQGVNFAAVLQNLSTGSGANGNNMQSVDGSGRPLNGRWAPGAPNFPGAPVVNNQIGNNQPNVMFNNRGTVPNNVPAGQFPTMSGNGNQPIIK